MASFAAANEWQGWWPVPQLRFELNQACEKLRLVTGYLHREKHYSAYLQGELERFQAHHHKSLKDLLEWQKERDWQATCALRKKEEELSSLQRRCARKHEAENPTCHGVSLDELKTQMVRKYMDENKQLSFKVEQLEMKLTENKGEDFRTGKLVEEEASPKAPKERSERRQGRRSFGSTVSTECPGEEDREVEDLEENKFPDEDKLDEKEEDHEVQEPEAPSQVLPAGQCKPCGWGSLCSELRFEISSYLAVPALCAARATSREGSSTEAFVASVVQLLEPRLSVFMACADLYVVLEQDKLAEHEQALAEKNFQLFARVQGFRSLFFMETMTVKRWWDTSQLALTDVVKSLVQHSSDQPIRRLLLLMVRVAFRVSYDRGYKRFLGEQLLAVLCYCNKKELRHACGSFAYLAKDCHPDLAKQCIEASAEVWLTHCKDPPELQVPAIRALAAWTTNFPEHCERIREMGVTL